MMIRKLFTRPITLIFAFFMLAACDNDTKIEQSFTIVAFGDSLTEGYSLPTDRAFPAQLQARFMANGHVGVKVMNMGISGDTSEGGLSRLHFAINANPRLVILELGANDILRNSPADETRKSLATMLAAFKAANIPVLLCGVEVPSVYTLANDNLSAYEAMFESLAKEFDVEYYPNFLKGVTGKQDLNLPDRLHPNEKGVAVLTENIYPAVENMALDIYEQMPQGR